ncbi:MULTISPECIES: glycosyltransferase family 4 protein [Pseudonocardia]|uniref:Glycosyl transferase n=2 Tax=Pseudonocardia TaxID=1847 RepID=A0ABQ0S6V6_9PSEU|nr:MULTISPECIES: glycosyltransferase family 4 protein [Pseudonocardia]OSY35181.1 putative glycosyl transferase [Pseudonocardia autotrophica]TDN74990.1 glycosyltransferase involved in cell wall biosynthesis [Pseudonocardia autotrophica]BBF98931.1 glycosyl transferase [Pseudonocardia autotrophica]GEC28653.1 glycosyl transferase [Pseudonocardia saturnea]
MSMRVTIASRIFRPEAGAAAYRLGALADELAERGHEVTVLTTVPPGGGTDDGAITVRRWPVLRDRSGSVRGYLQYLSFDIPLLVRLLRTRSDVVVVEPPPTSGAVTRLMCALTRTPYHYFAADVVSAAAAGVGVNGSVVRLLAALERWALNGSRGVIAVSEGVRQSLIEIGVRDDLIDVVGMGIDTVRFTHRPGLPAPDGKTLVYAGTMSEIHGADVFVRAFAEIADTHPDARLVMFGRGVEVPALQRLADELVPGRIEIRSPASPAVLSDEFSVAHAALASVKPGVGYDFAFATKALSGLSAGAPVIYSGVGPLGPVIREHELGWAVDWDPAAVAKAMNEALSSPPDGGRRTALSRWVREHHSLRSVAAAAANVVVGPAARDDRSSPPAQLDR